MYASAYKGSRNEKKKKFSSILGRNERSLIGNVKKDMSIVMFALPVFKQNTLLINKSDFILIFRGC